MTLKSRPGWRRGGRGHDRRRQIAGREQGQRTVMKKRPALVVSAFATLVLASAGCVVGPDYRQPAIGAPPAFKEQPPVNVKEAEAAGWKQSQPGDAYAKGRWWELYNDAALNALEEQVNVSNQNVLQAEALYRQARAAVRVARSPLFPSVTTAPAITTSGGANAGGNNSITASGGVTGNSSGASSSTVFTLPVSVSWEPDLWGAVRRGVSASTATAEAAAASVGNARLLFQAELAQDYFGLRGIDAEAELLARTEASYTEYLTLTRNRFSAGIASDLDVAQAETQLYGSTGAVDGPWRTAGGVRTCDRHPDRQSARGSHDSRRRRRTRLLRRCRWGCRPSSWSGGRTSPAPSGRWPRPTSRLGSRWRRSTRT